MEIIINIYDYTNQTNLVEIIINQVCLEARVEKTKGLSSSFKIKAKRAMIETSIWSVERSPVICGVRRGRIMVNLGQQEMMMRKQ